MPRYLETINESKVMPKKELIERLEIWLASHRRMNASPYEIELLEAAIAALKA
jgi:hypothetical protein